MTAKRFTLKGLIEGVPNICDNGEIIEQEEAVILLNDLHNENEQLKSENKRLKRLTTQYHVIDIEKVLPVIAECKGITVEEYLEEIEEEYTKEGDLE